MSKYSSDFKLKVVKYCIEDNHSSYEASKTFKIPVSPIKKWISKYREHGYEGLIRNQNISYDGDFKQYVVEYMRDNHLSSNEVAIRFNLAGDYVVSKWERIYYEEGPQALFEERRGRPRMMSSKKNKKNINENEDLLEEVQRLRMENEYLKKLNALVQERIKRENKKK